MLQIIRDIQGSSTVSRCNKLWDEHKTTHFYPQPKQVPKSHRKHFSKVLIKLHDDIIMGQNNWIQIFNSYNVSCMSENKPKISNGKFIPNTETKKLAKGIMN